MKAAVAAGADAIGLVLAESTRRVSLETAERLVELSPVVSVLVTVDTNPDDLMAAVAATGAGGVQPHGRFSLEAGDRATAAGLLVLHPVGVTGLVSDSDLPEDRIPLFDSGGQSTHGGSGVEFDWRFVSGVDRDFVLAGGLGPDNVGAAVEQLRPWGVDASSRLESAPGVKDPDLIEAFVREAKTR